MFRRRLTVAALLVAALAASACSIPTAPKKVCQHTQGSDTRSCEAP